MHGIYFSAKNDKEGFRLPVNPEKVGASTSGDGEKFSIAKTGKVNIPKDVELETYNLDCFFPTEDYSFLVASYRDPEYYISYLKRWQINKLPVRFMYVNGSFAINELVTIEVFSYEEVGGNRDVNYSLTLKKYVDFSPEKMKVVKKSSKDSTKKTTENQLVKKKSPPRQNKREELKTYILIRGDTLWGVAKKFLGNGNRYPEIQKLNGIKDNQLRSLPIGLKIKLPNK